MDEKSEFWPRIEVVEERKKVNFLKSFEAFNRPNPQYLKSWSIYVSRQLRSYKNIFLFHLRTQDTECLNGVSK